MYLAPSNASGIINTCRWATRDCRSLCLYKSGYASVYPSVNKARIKRTKFMAEDTVESTERSFTQELKVRFIEGGPGFMGIVLLCLILGLAISIERIIYLLFRQLRFQKDAESCSFRQ
jgi:hypothetical protein